jgi:hypothetical protein
MYQKGKTNIYLGPKITFVWDGGKPAIKDSTNKRFFYPMNIGAEYLFAEHFSIGGEVFYYYWWTAIKNKDGTITKHYGGYTGSRIILRFYF